MCGSLCASSEGGVSSGQAQELTRSLPPELIAEATSQNSAQAKAVDKDGLIDQISGEVHSVDAEKVEKQVATVLSTLKRWAPNGEIDDTVAQLPASLAALFE